MAPRTCVTPDGRFKVGIHDPGFRVENLRENTFPAELGKLPDGTPVENHVNFPASDVTADRTDRIYEVANPFPFRGTTFINSAWADGHAGRPETVRVPPKPACSLRENLSKGRKDESVLREYRQIYDLLPRPMMLALAQASTDPAELVALARKSCDFVFEDDGVTPAGLSFTQKDNGTKVPVVHDHDLYDILGNNPGLPDSYKQAMVLRPGIQGNSEIIGEAVDGTHVFEYLRRNSYIPWGHYAANMANDRIRYRTRDLTEKDMAGIRHLYYQRIYVRLAEQLDISLPAKGRALAVDELENLRQTIVRRIKAATPGTLTFTSSLWGWNFGFGFAQSGHRLHASHQMIHQQNAMIPGFVADQDGEAYDCFSCGDLVADFIKEFKQVHGKDFFPAYLNAIKTNRRTDGRADGPDSLTVHEDENVILFAPKAQVSEWELQLMTKQPCPHILAADTATRASLDRAMLIATQALETLGAQMITSVEFSGRFTAEDTGQHLVYSFIPRLPYAPGTFSEAQLRWICGCYPEDLADACRRAIKTNKEVP
ncbi:MAG TPA: hypothetical protein DHV36_11750 [Desulfobacteraceae bacterium]|nr:hypothetical protein [Desulfobacteraceae bacterium]